MVTAAARKEEEIEEDSTAKVEKDVHSAMKILAENQGVKLTSKDYPKVIVSKKDTSSYNPKEKSITIIPRHIGDGITYFEEASHALRDLTQERNGVPYDYQDDRVQEFIGRAGETFGRNLTKGTDLEYLFRNTSPRDMNNPKTKELWLNNLLKIKEDKKQLRGLKKELDETRSLLKKEIGPNYSELNNLLYDYQKGDISFDEFYEECSNLRDQYIERKKKLTDKGLRVYKTDKEELGVSGADYRFLMNSLRNIKGLPETEREKELDTIVNSIKEHYNYGPYSLKFEDKDLSFISTNLDVLLRQDSHLVHRKPYLYAQQYSPEELKGIYDKSDKDIKKEFFKRKQSSLEKTVSASLIILMPVLIMQLVLNMRLTGLVLGINPVGTSIFGIIIFFMLILLVYFEVRFRRRK
jgi:hypothetical protein